MREKLYRPRLRSKNYSCDFLRPKSKNIKLFPVRSLIRLGSVTSPKNIFYKPCHYVEVNSIEAIEISRSKLRMKEAFASVDIPQSDWYIYSEKTDRGIHLFDKLAHPEGTIASKDLPYPLIAKRINGFKGKGMKLLESEKALVDFISNNSLSGYYFEEFHNYSREYRIHCTKNEVIMRWRKLRKTDAEKRWYFNSDNCIWAGEDNSLFDSPSNLNEIDEHCLEAIRSVGLDIGAVDVRVQSNKRNKIPDYIILEVNSAPSLGDKGNSIYANVISNIIDQKIKNSNLQFNEQ